MWRTGLVGVVLFASFILLDACFPLKVNIPYSQIIEASDGSLLHASLASDGQWRMQAGIEDITGPLKKAILFKEDRYFYDHPGINPLSVARALASNLFQGRRTSGASTITMQVARLLDPASRTYGHKFLEMFRALQLEWHYSKDQILVMYFNLAPFGSNIVGIKAAAERYFDKSPSQLSLAELTTLSVIPNRPNSLVIGKDDAAAQKERDKWLRRFRSARLFPAGIIRDALAEPLHAYRHNMPSLAPQFCLRIHQLYPGRMLVRSSLNLPVQSRAQLLLEGYMSTLNLKGIHNGAVMIIDNRTHEVAGYLGSEDFTDTAAEGQVDGIRAVRSPGSALKPLLYGMAFDQGLITPKTVINDVPLNFRGYAPENYDRQFNGPVTAEYALENSLNIPAVRLLDQIGVHPFVSRLAEAGFGEIRADERELGLSLILGGCGVRLDEMTGLYSALANEGKFYPLSWLKTDVDRSGPLSSTHWKVKRENISRLLSPAAAFMITDILSKADRPDLPPAMAAAGDLPAVAWKTGTSYGRRDAWSIGYNRDFTVGIWIGNFTGNGVADLSGATIATPLLFQIFNAIDHNPQGKWYTPPASVRTRLVCVVTGKPPADFCNQLVMDYYIPGISSNAICDHLKRVWVSADGKMSYCTSCLPATGYLTRWYPNISPELAGYDEAHHIPYEKIPPHNPSCSRVFQGSSPVITSPYGGLSYFVERKEGQQLMLACTTSNDVKTVYWYINDRFLVREPSGTKIFFTPQAPEIKISCTDDKGRNSDIYIRVSFI